MSSLTANQLFIKPAPGDRGPVVTAFADKFDYVDKRMTDYFVSVKDPAFGAKGDGKFSGFIFQNGTDDQPAIQAAIDQVGQGGTIRPTLQSPKGDTILPSVVYLPPGIYVLNKGLALDPFIHFKGAGIDKTILLISPDFETDPARGGMAVLKFKSACPIAWDPIRPLITDMAVLMTCGPTSSTLIGFLANYNMRHCLIQRVLFQSTHYAKNIGLYIPNTNYDTNLQPTTTHANHNCSFIRDCTFTAFRHPTKGAIYADGHNDTQAVSLERIWLSNNTKNIVWGGLNCVFKDIYSEPTVNAHIISTKAGFAPRIEFNNGPNYLSCGYADVMGQYVIHFHGASAAGMNLDPSINPKIYIEGFAPNITSRKVMLFFTTREFSCYRSAANTIKVLGARATDVVSSTTVSSNPRVVWINDGNYLAPYTVSSTSDCSALNTGGGFELCQHTGVELSAKFSVGDKVYLNTQRIFAQVTSITQSAGGAYDQLRFAGSDITVGTSEWCYKVFIYGTTTAVGIPGTITDSVADFVSGGVQIGMVLRSTSASDLTACYKITSVAQHSLSFEQLAGNVRGYFVQGDGYLIFADGTIVLTTDPPAASYGVKQECLYPSVHANFQPEDNPRYFTAGNGSAALAQHKLVYIGADGLTHLADPGSASTMPAVGILGAAATANAVKDAAGCPYILTSGIVRLPGLTPGAVYYAGTSGDPTPTPPGANKQVIGIAISTTELKVNFNLPLAV